MKKLSFLFVLIMNSHLFSQDAFELNRIFSLASSEFNVPIDIVKSVAYAESRFTHINSEEVISCNKSPKAFGIMGLRDDDWFGHSLVLAAQLINSTSDQVKFNLEENVRGATALLSHYANELRIKRNDYNSWRFVLEKFSGIPQSDIKELYSYEIYQTLANGVELNGIKIDKHDVNLEQFSDRVKKAPNKLYNTLSDDWPPAVWDPSPNFTTGSINQKFAVVHDTEGSFASAVSWLKNPSANASAHYVIRSSDGYTVQLVREANRAWHAVCWNPYMLGVEHEGYVSNPAWFTDTMYITSAALFRHFALKFSFPIDRNHIIGHNEWQNQNWVNWAVANGYPSTFGTCNSHTDPGVYWDWNFYLQLISQDQTPARVLSVEPNNPADSAWPNSKIKITFNQRMRKLETQNAFSISPTVNGTFSWENFGKTLVFTPITLLSLGTTYTVTIDSNAINFNYVRLDGDANGTPGGNYSFNFTTKTYSALNITKTYPTNGQRDISPTVEVKINFDSPLIQSTITNNVLLYDGSNNNLPIANLIYEEISGKGRISFTSASPLQYNSIYKIVLKTGIKNTLGAPLNSETVIEFFTEQNTFNLETIIDDLETIGGWKDPDYSGSTIGTDPNATTFTIVTNKKVSGSASGKITYVFTGNTGVCRTFNSNKPNIGNDPSKKFGMWIYGDLSYHYLEFWFYYNTSTNVTVRVDTIDWTGWKFIEIPISSIPGTGDKLFHSVVLIQNPNGEKSGAIYIDGIQTRTTTQLSETQPPFDFSLSQNFPNPFNSNTNFVFTLPAKGFVTLKVRDILGREVKTLIEEMKDAGVHYVNFDFKDLASGMYFYTLSNGNNSLTRKMILAK